MSFTVCKRLQGILPYTLKFYYNYVRHNQYMTVFSNFIVIIFFKLFFTIIFSRKWIFPIEFIQISINPTSFIRILKSFMILPCNKNWSFVGLWIKQLSLLSLSAGLYITYNSYFYILLEVFNKKDVYPSFIHLSKRNQKKT